MAGKEDKSKKPDWIKIRAEYETTGISQRKLAAKYNVPYPTLRDRAKREKWTIGAHVAREKLVATTRARIIEKRATKLAKEIDPALEATSLINQLVLDTLKDEKQFKRHLIQRKEKEMFEGSGTEKWWVEEQEFEVVDTKRLRDLAQALKISKELQRLLQGLLEPEAEKKLDIEKERLELEKKKVEKDLAAGEEVFEIVDPFQEGQEDES